MELIVLGKDTRKCFREVLESLEGVEKDDTEASERIFKLEEGYEDAKIISGEIKKTRRDWLVIADIYNNGERNQKFHLRNYIEFKLKNGANLEDSFYDGRIRNAALYLYIREVIYGDDVQQACESVVNFYEKSRINDDNYKINSVPGLHSFF